MQPEMAKQLKALQKENVRLKKMVAELATSGKLITEFAEFTPFLGAITRLRFAEFAKFTRFLRRS